MTDSIESLFSSRFHSRYLHALEPIIRSAQECEYCVRISAAGLMVEPCPDGGVILAVTNGTVLAAVRDPEGRASVPARVTIPDTLFRAATPPPAITLNTEGEDVKIPLPEWVQPGEIILTPGSGIIFPQMPLPGDIELLAMGVAHGPSNPKVHRTDEYRVYDQSLQIHWRRAFTKERRQATPGTVTIDPRLFAYFSPLIDLFDVESRPAPRVYVDHASGGDATFIRVEGAPDFVGAVMPMREGGTDTGTPAWATPAAATLVEATLGQQNSGWREIDRQGFQTEDTEIAPIYRAMVAASPYRSNSDAGV